MHVAILLWSAALASGHLYYCIGAIEVIIKPKLKSANNKPEHNTTTRKQRAKLDEWAVSKNEGRIQSAVSTHIAVSPQLMQISSLNRDFLFN